MGQLTGLCLIWWDLMSAYQVSSFRETGKVDC